MAKGVGANRGPGVTLRLSGRERLWALCEEVSSAPDGYYPDPKKRKLDLGAAVAEKDKAYDQGGSQSHAATGDGGATSERTATTPSKNQSLLQMALRVHLHFEDNRGRREGA